MHVLQGMAVSHRTCVLTNVSIEHFLNTATHCVDARGWIWTTPSGKWFPKTNLPALFYMRVVCHSICHKFVFSPEYTWSSKVKILCLRTISETNRWPVSVYTPLGDQWLCNNWGNATLDLWSGRVDSFPLVRHICTSELDPGNWISIG